MRTFNRDKFLKKLGNWLLTLRKKRNLAQDALTEKAGLARGIVSKIENGTVDPRATTLVKLAHALDVPPPKVLHLG